MLSTTTWMDNKSSNEKSLYKLLDEHLFAKPKPMSPKSSKSLESFKLLDSLPSFYLSEPSNPLESFNNVVKTSSSFNASTSFILDLKVSSDIKGVIDIDVLKHGSMYNLSDGKLTLVVKNDLEKNLIMDKLKYYCIKILDNGNLLKCYPYHNKDINSIWESLVETINNNRKDCDESKYWNSCSELISNIDKKIASQHNNKSDVSVEFIPKKKNVNQIHFSSNKRYQQSKKYRDDRYKQKYVRVKDNRNYRRSRSNDYRRKPETHMSGLDVDKSRANSEEHSVCITINKTSVTLVHKGIPYIYSNIYRVVFRNDASKYPSTIHCDEKEYKKTRQYKGSDYNNSLYITHKDTTLYIVHRGTQKNLFDKISKIYLHYNRKYKELKSK